MRLAEYKPLYESEKSLHKAGYNTQRIKSRDIGATLKAVSEIIDVPTKDLHKLGSTGKLDTSGDIDIAIDSNEYSPNLIRHLLKKYSKDKYKEHKGIKVYSYAVPIRGEEDKGLVQLDVIFTPNPDWAKFAYHSEGADSKYKGAIRAILLSAVANNLNQKGMDHIEYDPNDNEISIQAGRKVDLPSGMLRTFKHRPSSNGGTAKSKKMQSIDIDEFKERYPNVDVKGGQIIVDDPEKVVKLLFGTTTTVDDVKSVEKLLRLIKKKFDDETQEKIFAQAAKAAKPLRTKMRIPPELEIDD